MAVTFEKRQLIVTLGENQTPSAYQFTGIKTFTDDASGEVSPATPATQDATKDEVDTILGTGIADATAQLNAMGLALGEANVARDAAVATATELSTKMSLLITNVGNAATQAHANAQQVQTYLAGVTQAAIDNAQAMLDFIAQLQDAHDEQLTKMAEAAKS